MDIGPRGVSPVTTYRIIFWAEAQADLAIKAVEYFLLYERSALIIQGDFMRIVLKGRVFASMQTDCNDTLKRILADLVARSNNSQKFEIVGAHLMHPLGPSILIRWR